MPNDQSWQAMLPSSGVDANPNANLPAWFSQNRPPQPLAPSQAASGAPMGLGYQTGLAPSGGMQTPWQAPSSWNGTVPPGLQNNPNFANGALPGPWGQAGWMPGTPAGPMMGQQGQGTVMMKAPDGTISQVPAEHVQHFQSRGAMLAGGQ